MSYTISPFMLRVASIAWELQDEGEDITVTAILDILDEEYNYNKKTYKSTYSRVYSALRRSLYLGFNLWNTYSTTQQYREDYKLSEYYVQNDDSKTWRELYFKTLFDMEVFTREQMEDSIIEARLFENYLDVLRRANIIFVIAGRGTREYTLPTYHDFCFYKYRNILQTARMADRQITQMSEAELMLPPGITPSQIEDLTRRLLAALEDQTRT